MEITNTIFEKGIISNSLLSLDKLINASVVDANLINKDIFLKKTFFQNFMENEELEASSILGFLLKILDSDLINEIGENSIKDKVNEPFDIFGSETININLFEAKIFEMLAYIDNIASINNKRIIYIICDNKVYKKLKANRFFKVINNFRGELYGKDIVCSAFIERIERIERIEDEALCMVIMSPLLHQPIAPLNVELTLPYCVSKDDNGYMYEYYINFTKLTDIYSTQVIFKV